MQVAAECWCAGRIDGRNEKRICADAVSHNRSLDQWIVSLDDAVGQSYFQVYVSANLRFEGRTLFAWIIPDHRIVNRHGVPGLDPTAPTRYRAIAAYRAVAQNQRAAGVNRAAVVLRAIAAEERVGGGNRSVVSVDRATLKPTIAAEDAAIDCQSAVPKINCPARRIVEDVVVVENTIFKTGSSGASADGEIIPVLEYTVGDRRR